jgi:hypothetical protein
MSLSIGVMCTDSVWGTKKLMKNGELHENRKVDFLNAQTMSFREDRVIL